MGEFHRFPIGAKHARVAVVTVEEVSGRAAYKRFFELAYMQFRAEPKWSPPVTSGKRSRNIRITLRVIRAATRAISFDRNGNFRVVPRRSGKPARQVLTGTDLGRHTK